MKYRPDAMTLAGHCPKADRRHQPRSALRRGGRPVRALQRGDVFGQLEVIAIAARRHGSWHAHWVCLCRACGEPTIKRSDHLVRGCIMTCGCQQNVRAQPWWIAQ